MGLVAWVATFFSILYLFWAIKNNTLCFLFGILSCVFWGYESYFHLHLKFDAGLQVFYLILSVVGYYRWKYGGEANSEKPIAHYPLKKHLGFILIGVIVSLILIYLSNFIEIIALPRLDAVTTVFMIIGSILLVERELYCWIYLVICDIVYVYIYGVQGAWLFVGMMIIYTVFGTIGFFSWKKLINLPQRK